MNDNIKDSWVLASHSFGLTFLLILSTIFFLAYLTMSKRVCFLVNVFGEANFEAILIPIIIVFCLIGFYLEIKLFWGN